MGRIIGDGGWYFHVADMATLPDHQRRGLGVLVLSTLLERIAEHAPRRLRLPDGGSARPQAVRTAWLHRRPRGLNRDGSVAAVTAALGDADRYAHGARSNRQARRTSASACSAPISPAAAQVSTPYVVCSTSRARARSSSVGTSTPAVRRTRSRRVVSPCGGLLGAHDVDRGEHGPGQQRPGQQRPAGAGEQVGDGGNAEVGWRGQSCHPVGHQPGEEVVLRGVVAVERAQGHAGALGHLRHLHPLEPVLGSQPARLAQDPVASRVLSAGARLGRWTAVGEAGHGEQNRRN